MAPTIPVPVVLGGGWQRHLWSVNGESNDTYTYPYCANLCLSSNVHCGHDVEANFEPINAATDGVVKFAGEDGFYEPFHVDIEPTVGPFRGEYHIYGHLSEVWVSNGQQVARGQPIGRTGTAGTGPHVHWERRTPDPACGYRYRSTDPTAVLSSPNANVDGGGGGEFERKDKIAVSDGPVRLRQAPGLAFTVIEELPTGVQLCVTGEHHDADGFTWSPVRVLNTNRAGWVATQFCSMVDAQACQDETLGGGPLPSAVPGITEAVQPFTPHPDTGMTPEEFAAMLERSPHVEYDGAGNFAGVSFPAPPEAATPAADDRPWVKG